mgnify:CR=1 FL=1
MPVVALISTLLKVPGITSLLGSAAEGGKRRFSKTKVGANLAMLGAGWEVLPTLLPAALGGDPEAIGKLILIIGGYVLTLWGRGNK